MEDKMAAGAFGRARNYGWAFSFITLSFVVNVSAFARTIVIHTYTHDEKHRGDKSPDESVVNRNPAPEEAEKEVKKTQNE